MGLIFEGRSKRDRSCSETAAWTHGRAKLLQDVRGAQKRLSGELDAARMGVEQLARVSSSSVWDDACGVLKSLIRIQGTWYNWDPSTRLPIFSSAHLQKILSCCGPQRPGPSYPAWGTFKTCKDQVGRLKILVLKMWFQFYVHTSSSMYTPALSWLTPLRGLISGL